VAQTGDRVERGQELATVYSPELLAAQQELLNARRWAQQGSPSGGLEADARQKLELLGISETEIAELEKTGRPQRAMKIPRRSAATSSRAPPCPACTSRPAPSSSRWPTCPASGCSPTSTSPRSAG
jgi:hypothetical protein